MARWRLYWLTMSATYTGVVAVAIAVHEPYQGVWFNILVLLGPPVIGYVVGTLAERR